ncbi:hypothetical protein OE88DRAFT_1653428 [Heliocybe sulcata]|uniref:Uncharacterized protein n=1 Tax=Heliocybe sulcata TaxID=5364 RepID=A0A5C3NC39_9AGAM|nr:hypothetical protein OE88DRAFT_1653428 [Heliocybe sulcata]
MILVQTLPQIQSVIKKQTSRLHHPPSMQDRSARENRQQHKRQRRHPEIINPSKISP